MAFGIGPVLTMGAIEALIRAWLRRTEEPLSRKARLRRMDGDHEPHRAAGGLRSRRDPLPRRARRRRHLPHHRPEDLHHLRRARSHRQHRASRAGAPARCARRHARHLAVPRAEVPARRHAQRRALPRHRAQARHPCLAHLHHDLRRRWRRRRLAGRRGESRPRLHVHDDEQRPPRGRPAGRGDRRARLSAGARLRQRAPAGTRHRRCGRHEPDRRASGRAAQPAHHEGAHRRGARDLLHDGGGHRPRASRSGSRAPEKSATSAPRC